jgi:signal transduction histidine kinase
MLGATGSVERRLSALVLVSVLGLVFVGAAGYVGTNKMRGESERAAHLQQALSLQQDADMVHDTLRSDVLAAERARPGRRRELVGLARNHRDRAVHDMEASNALLTRSGVGRGLALRARADAAALRRYADDAVIVAAAAPQTHRPERERLWKAFGRRRDSLASLTDAIQAEVSSAHRSAITTSDTTTRATATVDIAVLLLVLALATGIMDSIRRILRAKARAEDELAHQNIALREQADALIEADQLKDRLLAVTSHEIRGDLSATIVAVRTAQRLTDRATPAQLGAPLRMAERHAEHVLGVVVDLLNSAAPSVAHQPERPRWNDVFDIAQLAIGAAERHKDDHHLDLEIPPIVCDVDANRLQQVLRNLIENSYKYTPRGCHVLVRAEAEQRHLVITIADNGHGMSRHLVETVLQAHRRGPHEPGTEGHGLGLFVVNELVCAMGGTLDIASAPRAGTTITLRLPCEHRLPDQVTCETPQQLSPG